MLATVAALTILFGAPAMPAPATSHSVLADDDGNPFDNDGTNKGDSQIEGFGWGCAAEALKDLKPGATCLLGGADAFAHIFNPTQAGG